MFTHHGRYSPVSECSVNSNSNIAKLQVLYDDGTYTAVSIEDMKGDTRVFILSNVNASTSEQHRLKIDNKHYEWTGLYHLGDS